MGPTSTLRPGIRGSCHISVRTRLAPEPRQPYIGTVNIDHTDEEHTAMTLGAAAAAQVGHCLVPRLSPSGRARTRGTGAALWCRSSRPRLAQAAHLRAGRITPC